MFKLGEKSFHSRLLLGTALYPSPQIMMDAIQASGTQIVTVSLRRQAPQQAGGQKFWDLIRSLKVEVLPNTAGCHSVQEAVTTAQMARDLFETNWVKLEVIGDEYNLQPDPFGLVEAARTLVQQGFEVFPYCTDDLVVCQRLLGVGCRILMPWGSPIGTGLGILNLYQARVLRERLENVPLILDAGVGKPSHAAQAMELGYDGVLLNTAVAQSQDPVAMARAFAMAIDAGRVAHQAGLIPARDLAKPSTPVTGTPFWHQKA
ncbi:MAG: thiazole synthase [Acidobacteria bacterium]|nr:thiazole synthase [Acidobacteriota bacterium]MCB9397439.1 thiazole synthase [Acidobacteriota bacterium]